MDAQPGSIGQDRIKAAQEFDAGHRPANRNWTSVPDEQVMRLLAGADLYMTSVGMTITDAEVVPYASSAGNQG